MMRYLLLSVLVVSLIGVLVIPDAYSDIQYNIKEGTTVDYNIDSICKISAYESAKAAYERSFGKDLESELKDRTCNDSFDIWNISPNADRYFWDTVSTISVTVLDSSTDGHKFSDGKYGYRADVLATMKNGTIKNHTVFVTFGENWKYGIPSNLKVGDIIGEISLVGGDKITAKITDRKIMTVGGTPYVILIASNDCNTRLSSTLDYCWKYFYEKETGMIVGREDNVYASWGGGMYDEVRSTATASTSVMFTNISTAQPITQQTQQTQQPKGGGCLIATATFGSEIAPQVQFLRELRDNTVLQTESGTSFMTGFNQFYYSFSPYIADYERENPAFKETVKLALTPLLTSLTLLQYADIDSESEMLGYGIGVILLNIGMYFMAPAVLIMTIRKRI
jgi:hypothetical protein